MSDKLGGTLGLDVVRYQGGVDELNAKCRERDDEIDRLRSLLEDLVRAVEPFAEFSRNFSKFKDGDVVWGLEAGGTFLKRVTVGDLRRAREAYLKAKGETNGT